MIKTIEKIFYTLYRESRKANKEYDSAFIATLFFSVGVLFLLLNIDSIIEYIFKFSFLLSPETKWSGIAFTASLYVLLLFLFVFNRKYKRIEEKYIHMSKSETQKINRITIIYYSITFVLLIINVIVYNLFFKVE